MDLRFWRFPVRALLGFYLIFLLYRDCGAQICTAPAVASVEENKPSGTHVLTVTVQQGVTLALTVNPGNFFKMQETNVVVNTSLDYETQPNNIEITIRCSHPDLPSLDVQVLILIQNINDNVPTFAQNEYNLTTPELSPVGAMVGLVEATDQDGDLLFYHMEPENEYFTIESATSPLIVVKKIVDYDVVKSVSFRLIAVDTRSPPPPGAESFTATATVSITITDEDNRPPWFQPCQKANVGSGTICLGSGYRGRVNLTEQTEGILPLEPGPLYAIDGDEGRNEQIIYRILGGNEAAIFQLDENSGNITMQKAADVAGPIVLTVLALQLVNSHQYASTSVTFDVVIKSQHAPQFEQQQYEGLASSDTGPGSLVLEKSSDRPLRVRATDADFIDGVNPAMRYMVEDSSSFTVTNEGFILTVQEMPPGTVALQIRAVDSSNGEFGTTAVSIQVLPGATTALPTTAMPTTAMPTTAMPTTAMPTTAMPTTAMPTTAMATTAMPTTAMPTTAVATTAMPTTAMPTTAMPTTAMATTAMLTTGVDGVTTGSPSTSDPMTTQPQDGTTGPITAHTELPKLPGQYREADMAALGASLAVLIVLCLAIIALLLVRIKKGDAAWKKLSEASLFRSTLARGSGGLKEGVQYTNSGFQNDGDTGSVTSDLPNKAGLSLDGVAGGGQAREMSPEVQAALTASALRENFLPDSSSLAGSDQADSEKEVKPILTKERRNEEGYKSVWFKEDIDPNAKEEVVIIPDSRERDANEEEEDDSMDGEDHARTKHNRNGAANSSDEEDADL